MKEDPADKTRIQKPERKIKKPVDATRISRPKGKPEGKPSPDKTRIASSSPQVKAGKDKTHIADNGTRPVPTVNATRFNPKRNFSADKTRIAPTREVLSDADAEASSESDPKHILKDRFVLEEVLGAGGMGVVYKAKDLLKVEAQDRDPYVAIKVLSEEFKAHPEAFISLQRESRKSQRIAHPNIVNVYDFDRDGDTVFMTMEFMDGDPLDDLIARYKSTGLPTDDAWEIIRGMSSALIHAHTEKIIHSDFKPGNVFVTQKGLAKVFDFGIARAVSQVEHLEDNPQDQTLFDAGNLGALTPAYASLEMLESEEPDVRDDIFALGCVAYEMLTGEHPYGKVPADEAQRQGLKPKRISHIKKRQWQAIEKAIAFRREDRLASVREFEVLISPKLKSSNWLVTSVAILFAIAITAYFLVFKEESKGPQFSEFDIRNELELKIRIDFLKEDIEILLKDPGFAAIWQDSIWKNISDLIILTKGEDIWVDERKLEIFNLYLEEIKVSIKNGKFIGSEKLVQNARRYSSDEVVLNQLESQIEIARKKAEIRKNLAEKKSAEEKNKKLAEQQKLQQQKLLQQTLVNEKQAEKNSQKQQFDVALGNLNNQLKCQANLNMRNFETAINKLKQLDGVRYAKMEKSVVNSLAACINQIGKSFPERARQAQKQSLKIFDSTILSSIKIKSRDPCDESLAGLGARGKRATCKDKLKVSGFGPEMVVIPSTSKLTSFAIGKYEVSVTEINTFCKASNSCSTIKQGGLMPVTKIPLSLAMSYLKWLSQQSGKKYRIPTKNEWMHAVKSRSKSLDPNRNCALSTRGFEKGSNLVKYSVGKQNSWGLINYVGNVQEWVYANGRNLEAVGGSFREPMESCTISTSKLHDGNADNHTGFRVLREIEG